ncbi:hypothetical protein JCM14076_28510 [Methylosoma difficile]
MAKPLPHAQSVYSQLPSKPLPVFPGWAAALGPGIVWMALAQGSGELIWWPYMVAKYGLAFLCLLLPACLIQYPINLEIGRYTLLTGESVFHGFIRLNRGLGIFLWLLMTVSFLWFGAFASAGGTALAALTHFPAGWEAREQTLFWGYLSIIVFLLAIIFSGVVYKLVENFMKGVAVTTVVGLVWACWQPDVAAMIPAFSKALVIPPLTLPRAWDQADSSKLLTAIAFAGLGGFWALFYSYWLRDKGVGMATYCGHVTGLAANSESVSCDGFLPADSPDNAAKWQRWNRFLKVDVSIGVLGNLFTTLMACLLAYALLFPQGLLPKDYELAVVQSRFFELAWGPVGKILFLMIAAAFLADTWLATVDAVSRIQADIVHILFPKTRRFATNRLYYVFLGVFTVITSLTMLLDTPDTLIRLSALIGFIGTIIFPLALYWLNYRLLLPNLPPWAQPSPVNIWLLRLSFVIYLALGVLYLGVTLS